MLKNSGDSLKDEILKETEENGGQEVDLSEDQFTSILTAAEQLKIRGLPSIEKIMCSKTP